MRPPVRREVPGSGKLRNAATPSAARPPPRWGKPFSPSPPFRRPGESMAKRVVKLNVNGVDRELLIEPMDVLLDVLRDDINLTGTKRGCDMGTCGCCTVLVDGEARLSCLTLAATMEGTGITTIEGLGSSDAMNPVQRAYYEEGGSQCGFCTPGFVMATMDLLKTTPNPTDTQIREGLSGNLCRCTGYIKIFDAVRRAALEMRAPDPDTLTAEPVVPAHAVTVQGPSGNGGSGKATKEVAQ